MSSKSKIQNLTNRTNKLANIINRRNITPVGNSAPMRKGRKQAIARSSGMSKATNDYIRLLTDPCNAPLVHGIYPGTGGGIVSRFESDFIYGGGATDTCLALVWVPGLNLVFQPNILLPSDNTVYANTLGSTTNMPGYNFLTTTAGSFRCVAACMQVSYPGSELNRSGVISLGVQDGASLMPLLPTTQGGRGGTVTVQQMRSMAQHTERTPATTAEIVWMPGEADGDNFSYGNAGPPPSYPGTGDGVQYQGRNALSLSAANLSLAVGLRIRLVYVCEWTPRVNQGIIASVQPSYSEESVAEVLMKLARNSPNWYIHAAGVASTLYSNMSTNRKSSMYLK